MVKKFLYGALVLLCVGVVYLGGMPKVKADLEPKAVEGAECLDGVAYRFVVLSESSWVNCGGLQYQQATSMLQGLSKQFNMDESKLADMFATYSEKLVKLGVKESPLDFLKAIHQVSKTESVLQALKKHKGASDPKALTALAGGYGVLRIQGVSRKESIKATFTAVKAHHKHGLSFRK